MTNRGPDKSVLVTLLVVSLLAMMSAPVAAWAISAALGPAWSSDGMIFAMCIFIEVPFRALKAWAVRHLVDANNDGELQLSEFKAFWATVV